MVSLIQAKVLTIHTKSLKRLAWSPNDFQVKFTVSKQDGFNIQIYLLFLCSTIFCKHSSPPSKQAIFIILTSPPRQPSSRVDERLKSGPLRARPPPRRPRGIHGLSQASTTVNWPTCTLPMFSSDGTVITEAEPSAPIKVSYSIYP